MIQVSKQLEENKNYLNELSEKIKEISNDNVIYQSEVGIFTKEIMEEKVYSNK